ncbi:hypothetical protein EWM64_g7402 [Hericium alpestre]|uniref:Uncharacterized protein n=1 Tax=Hericium alpestre TaxID=135208 RepID=A0A4Y9ZQV5_9AGAM|nr:hypothetical protein EWM64_g7402 [Hericium alpestre]
MAHRLPLRNRAGIQRNKNVDENATSKLRQATAISVARNAPSVAATKNGGPQRVVLNEVTTTAVNRKETLRKLTGKDGKEKDSDADLKRGRSSATTGAQRVAVPAQRGSTQSTAAARIPLRAQRPSSQPVQREVSEPPAPVVIAIDEEDTEDEREQSMEIEEVDEEPFLEARPTKQNLLVGEEEIEAMIGVQINDIETAQEGPVKYIWPDYSPGHMSHYQDEIERIRHNFAEESEAFDASMVSEYAEEIFEYMIELEDACMPNPNYMTVQNEISWPMRQTLVDWLLQVHLRYHMLPETLWIAVNIVDRFLSQRIVSLVKLQLVGVTAMFIASKYEEILAPSVDEFVYMTENGYTKEEILKGERIVLQTLDFRVSQYCSPYSWMRKISKADDYDIQTRTLSKFLTEVTLLDWRFVRVKPSMVAAVGMYTARQMLGGDWDEAFVNYSGFTQEQLIPGYQMMMEKLSEPGFEKLYVCKKYAHKKFLKASLFALEWARSQMADQNEGMLME